VTGGLKFDDDQGLLRLRRLFHRAADVDEIVGDNAKPTTDSLIRGRLLKSVR
jgi:hypothetical protein